MMQVAVDWVSELRTVMREARCMGRMDQLTRDALAVEGGAVAVAEEEGKGMVPPVMKAG